MRIPRRLVSIFGSVLVFFALLSPALAQESRVDVYEGGQVRSVVFIVGRDEYFVNGQTPGIKMDAKPFIKDGRTFVPIRYLAYGLGVAERDVGWNQRTRQVTLKRQGIEAKLTVGSRTMYTNGRAQQMDVAPRLEKDGRTYLPARWVANALGYEVEWSGDDRMVICWPKGEKKPEGDIVAVKQYVSSSKDDTALARQIWEKAKPYVGQPIDHSRFEKQSWSFERAKEISFITLQDLPARVGTAESGHVIVSIDLSEAETKANRIKVRQVALGDTTHVGVYGAPLILWMKDDDVYFEIPTTGEHKEHVFSIYYPLYNRQAKDIKYFVFASDGQLLAVKNPLYRGD